MSGDSYAANVQSIPTSSTALLVGSVTTPHYAMFQNQDDTNYVTIYNGVSGAVVIRLYPGEIALVPLDPTGAYYALANTAAVILSYLIFDR